VACGVGARPRLASGARGTGCIVRGVRRVLVAVPSLLAGIALLYFASQQARECARHEFALSTRAANPCVAWTGSLSHSTATVLLFLGWILVTAGVVLLLAWFVQSPAPKDGVSAA